MSIFENYIDRAIDELKSGSGDLFSEAVHDVHDHTGIPGVGGGGGGFSDLIQMSDNGNIITFPDSAPSDPIQWDPTAVGGATYRLVGSAISWPGGEGSSRIVINTAGYYDFYVSIAVSGPTDADCYGTALFSINGTPSNYGMPAHVWFPQNSAIGVIQAKLLRMHLDVDDYVEVLGLFVGSATVGNQGFMVEATRTA